MGNQTILIGLNEINFEFLEDYIKRGELKHFKSLLAKSNIIETESESKYELLEPWIQWVTVHTGKTYDEHKIFRLGDIVENKELVQLFEELESKGKTIGAISPFNAANKLKNASFFVPDPWTETEVTGSWFIKNFYNAIRQSVNDNAQSKITFSSLLALGFAFLFFVPIKNWSLYFKNVLRRKKPGVKAIILDSLLVDVFYKLWKSKKPDFSNLFLNSGAHIQHHYLFNSVAYKGKLVNPEWYCPKDWDPLLEILKVYDELVGKISKQSDLKIFIATGLHQQPHEKITFYWRLKDHAQFLDRIGVKDIKQILPRMSRDFLLEFSDSASAKNAETLLNSFTSSNNEDAIFRIDNRGSSLFIELIYPHNIEEGFSIKSPATQQEIKNFKSYVAFVAIKNGEHNGIGYLTSNVDIGVKDSIPLKDVKDIISKEVLANV